MLSVEGRLKPLPRIFPKGTALLVLLDLGLCGRVVRLVEGVVLDWRAVEPRALGFSLAGSGGGAGLGSGSGARLLPRAGVSVKGELLLDLGGEGATRAVGRDTLALRLLSGGGLFLLGLALPREVRCPNAA